MLRSLGIMAAFKWFVIACVGLAVWRAYDGNLGAIATAIWDWIQAGADVVTRIWDNVNTNGGPKKR
jgi:hypothetical protein